MSQRYDRREVLKAAAAAGASFLLPKRGLAVQSGLSATENVVEVQVTSVSAHTLRFAVFSVKNGQITDVLSNGSLVQTSWGEPILKLRGEAPSRTIKSGELRISVSTAPLSFAVATESGESIQRLEIDLETIPLYVRAGSILPLGPVKQYAEERVDQPLSISIYPGGNDSFLLYEDDGASFNYRKGEWMGLQLDWNDARRTLAISLATGSRMLPPSPLTRSIEVKLNQTTRALVFDGRPVNVSF